MRTRPARRSWSSRSFGYRTSRSEITIKRLRIRSTKRSSFAPRGGKKRAHLVTTLTKANRGGIWRLSRDVRIEMRYLHSDIDAIDVWKFCADYARDFDILVGNQSAPRRARST